MIESQSINSTYDQLIGALYSGTLECTPWESFLPLLGQALDAMAVSLVLRPPSAGDEGLILNYRRADKRPQQDSALADPRSWPISAYREQFFALDPFVNLPPGEVVTLAELMSDKELRASEYFQRYLQSTGVFHILGADTRAPDGLLARLRISRGEQDRPFDANDKAVLLHVVPHLQQAIRIHARLNRSESERDLYAIAMDRLAVGTVILDEHGKVLKSNALASQLLSARDGLAVHNGTLSIGNREQAADFQQLLQLVLRAQAERRPGVAEALRVSRPSGRADLGLVIRPVPTSEWAEGQSSPAVAVFISDPDQQTETSAQIITRLFGFTPAEAQLAMKLAGGLSLAEASSALGVSQHTARAQLKAVFAKASVTRQAELVRLIVKSVATLG